MLGCNEDIFSYCLLKHYIAGQDLCSLDVHTPWTWLAASLYIDERNYQIPILNKAQRREGKNAVGYYAAVYATKKVEKQQLSEIIKKENPYTSIPPTICDLKITKECTFHDEISHLIEDAFNQKVQVQAEDISHFVKLFDYPKAMSYSKKAKQIIYDKIKKDDFSNEEIAYFLCSNRDVRDYVERFQILRHIILDKTPDDSQNNLFVMEMAYRELSRIYNAIYEDSLLRKWFQKEFLDKLDKTSRAFEIIAINEKEVEKDNKCNLKDFITNLIDWYTPYFTQARINEMANNIDDIFKIVGEIIFDNTQCESLSTDDKGILVSKVNDLFLMLCDAADKVEEVRALSVLLSAIKKYAEPFYKKDNKDNNFIFWYRVDGGLKYAQRRAKAIEREKGNLLKYATAKENVN